MYIRPKTRGISGTKLKAARRRDARHRNRNMRVHSARNQDEQRQCTGEDDRKKRDATEGETQLYDNESIKRENKSWTDNVRTTRNKSETPMKARRNHTKSETPLKARHNCTKSEK